MFLSEHEKNQHGSQMQYTNIALVIATLSVILTGTLSVLLPNCPKDTKWKSTSLVPAMCDLNERDIPEMGIPIHVTYLSITTPHPQIDGVLCTKLVLVTRCTYYWYFHAVVEKLIEKEPVTTQECLEHYTLQKYDDEADKVAYFLPEECTWSLGVNIQDRRRVIITITPHQVTLDLRDNKLVDTLFKNNACRQEVCDTIHDNTKWIKTESSNICSKNKTMEGYIYTAKSNKNYLHGTLVPSLPLNHLCWETVCNVPALRTPQGIAIWVDKMSLIKGIPRCAEGLRLIKGVSVQTAEIEELKLLRQSMDWIMCQLFIRNQRDHSLTTVMKQLSFLHPKQAGIHPVYQTFGGVMHSATCNYVEGVLSQVSRGNQLGLQQHGAPIFWPFWDSPKANGSDPCSSYGPNGITRNSNCEIVMPKQREQLLEQFLSTQELMTVMFPQDSTNSRLPTELLPTSLQQTPPKISIASIFQSFENFWLCFKLSIVYWIISIVFFGILLYWLLFSRWAYMLRCTRGRRRQQGPTSDPQSFNLMSLS